MFGVELVSRAVDLLPERLWVPSNLIILRGGDRVIGHQSFYVGKAGGCSVRIVERNGRTLAHGWRHFDVDAY